MHGQGLSAYLYRPDSAAVFSGTDKCAIFADVMGAAGSYKAQGIVLHTVRYGDTSLVAYVLTDIAGRQTYLVQGACGGKGKGNKAALFQPMFPLEFEGIALHRSQMDRMKDIRLLEPLRSVPFDVRKSTIALFMAETLYKLVRESEADAALFAFVREAVLALDRMEEGVANFHLWFLVQLSAFLGFYPGNGYTAGDCFDIVEGLFADRLPDHGIVMNRPNAALLAELMECGVDRLSQLSLARSQRADFLTSLLHYFGYHLDTVYKIQSIRILGEVF